MDDDEHDLILLAAYGDADAARSDFDELIRRLQQGLELRGAILVSKDSDGNPTVAEAFNQHGRMGAALGAGVGILFGLFVPPLLLPVLVGAAAGGIWASFAEHEVRLGLRREIGAALDAGTAVVVALTFPNGRDSAQEALRNALEFRSVRVDQSTIKLLDETVAEEMKSIHLTSAKTGTMGTNT